MPVPEFDGAEGARPEIAPDVEVYNLNVPSVDVPLGQDFEVSFSVWNRGETRIAEVPCTVSVSYFVGNSFVQRMEILAEHIVTDLPPRYGAGQTLTVSIPEDIEIGPIHHIVVSAVVPGEPVEAMADNEVMVPISLTRGIPDLKVVRFEPDVYRLGAGPYVENYDYTLRIEIQNAGTAPSPPWRYKIAIKKSYLDLFGMFCSRTRTSHGYFDAPEMPPLSIYPHEIEMSHRATYACELGDPPERHGYLRSVEVALTVDHNDTIWESDESNNEASFVLNVVGSVR
jgi:hypothetical protein